MMEIVFWLAVAAWVHGLLAMIFTKIGEANVDIDVDVSGVGRYGLTEFSTATCVIVVFYFAGALN